MFHQSTFSVSDIVNNLIESTLLNVQEKASLTETHSYKPAHLSHVTHVFEDGKVNLILTVYFPNEGSSPEHSGLNIEVKVGNQDWQPLTVGQDPGFWSLVVEKVSPGTPILFRYQDPKKGKWFPLSPLTDLDTVYGTSYVPKMGYTWKSQPPAFQHAKVLMETTLEGLLFGYKGGRFAPQDREGLFQSSIAERILKTDIPGQIATWGIDELMIPVCSSISDRSHLDPKFNYLTYNVVELDWQIGRSHEFCQLVDTFYENKIALVPDLIFVHQVRSPFPGSLDQIFNLTGKDSLFSDTEAFLFRDYGTWMFKLSDPQIRSLLIEKIVSFVSRYQLKMIRLDYMDGLILQYSNRSENFAEKFVQELKQELNKVVPDLIILGETFEVAHNPIVKEFIDIFYAPIGFSIVEEMYKPPSLLDRPLYLDVEKLAFELNQSAASDRLEANYAQLHDETWYCQHIIAGRPFVPWAYGGNPAELARRKGEELVRMNVLEQANLLDFVRKTVRNAEAMTLFFAKLKYMFTPSVDALTLGCLDELDHWKVCWEGVTPYQIQVWQQTGLAVAEILRLHKQHREEMIQLRNIFRRYTRVTEEPLYPQVQPSVYFKDPESGFLGVLRSNPDYLEDTLVILFNLGPKQFEKTSLYELPIPLEGVWEIIFGDTQAHLQTTSGEYSNQDQVLRLEITPYSLTVLRYCPT